MDSAHCQLHVQIPQPTSSSNSHDPRLAHGPLLSSPGSAFDFTWIPEPPAARSPTASRPPRTSNCSSTSSPSSYRYSFSARQSSAPGFDAAASGPFRANPDSASSSLTSSRHIAVPHQSSSFLPSALVVDTALRPSAWLANSANSSPIGAYSVSPASSSPTNTSPRTTKPQGAMPSRPAKRSADGGGASDDDAHLSCSGKMKLARAERGPEDFSSVVKNRLLSYSRTGQACDRCKVRKIRCDALPEGCSHCINLNLECFVTDRVTGRTERRGYMQQLEREKNSMIAYIRDLERLCAEKGVEVKPWEHGATSARSSSDSANGESADATESSSPTESWSRYGMLYIKDSSSPRGSKKRVEQSRIPRNEWRTRPEETHWGVAGDDAPLSSLKGTTLTLLGTTIETTSFDAPDVDEPPAEMDPSMPLYNKSVQAFLRSVMGVNPTVQVDLPNRQNAFMYAEWYFITIASFMPVLHKPSFMKLLERVYDEPGYKPSVSELVLVHMVFSAILFQFGVRSSQTMEQRNEYNDLSNRHYHFALSKLYDIYSSSSFEALQGLVLIASHTRSFPKPGCGSIVANMALHRALELKLHRRTKEPGEPTNLSNELRKRAFWCIMIVVVAINGKRGYPVPISVQDFDVDFPEPIADELLSDDGVDATRTLPCPYEVAICGYKMVPILMEMYANIYSVRRDQNNYKAIVTALEAQLESWEADLPESLRLSASKAHDHGLPGPLFARSFNLETRLHLRHPSLAMTDDKDMITENTRICEEAAREYLETVEQLSKMKALDTTWYQMSIYCVAILSMLVPQWERRFEITQKEVTKLSDEMDRWMNIVKEMSLLLGCGSGMHTQIAELIDRTMSWIQHDMGQSTNGNAHRSSRGLDVKQERPQQHSQPTMSHPMPDQGHLNQAPSYPQHPSMSSVNSSLVNDPSKAYYETHGSSSSQPTYQSLAYVDTRPPQNTHHQTLAYQSSQQPVFYTTNTPTDHPAAGPSQSNPMVSYGQPLAHEATDLMWRTSWQNWTAAIADSQARYSADALLTLGGGGGGSRSEVVAPLIPDGGLPPIPHSGGELPMVPQPAQWPLIMFDQTPQQ
ncbi:hypothetical protein E4U19_002450 [Claviceps sp. Clav32 group G5]|nr:hypothetical protein E4U40_004207 [Claviceps sp. LM458 group G5]KAG6037226.1 hypothetical protein E4U19_002450 [Claviceps sp. Clav32 group G5]